jgi:hypothetical protein
MTNILFIGNSLTARNNLRALIAQLAAAHGIEVRHHLISAGGASLRRHLNAGAALKAIASRRYEYVVLQEQSTLPIKNAARMRESVLEFHHAIAAAGAKTVLYMTWARQHAHQTQDAISDAYRSIGKEIGGIVVPVGTAWEYLRKRQADVPLFDRDGSHPSLLGSILAACVFVARLFDCQPATLGLSDMSAPQKKLLEQATRAAVKRAW